jgi:hypothetical protein
VIRKDVLHVLNKHAGDFLTVDKVLAGTVDAMDAATMRTPFEDTTFLQAVSQAGHPGLGPQTGSGDRKGMISANRSYRGFRRSVVDLEASAPGRRHVPGARRL